jgi:PAS domain S-box-containing protein
MDTFGHLTYLNAEAEKLLGWRFDELEGKTLHNIIHHHTREGHAVSARECPIHLSIKNNQVFDSDREVFFHRDGHMISVHVRSTPLLLDAAFLGSVTLFSKKETAPLA